MDEGSCVVGKRCGNRDETVDKRSTVIWDLAKVEVRVKCKGSWKYEVK